jgi:predicted CXXCH cytochrome family protein
MSRKSMHVVIMVACFIFSISSLAAGASIVGSKHDFSALSPQVGISNFAGNFLSAGNDIVETCVFCHTPHNASAAGYLWNRTTSSVTGYTLYTSSTITMINITAPTGLSLMCMSCHDGITSIAVNTLVNAPYPATNPAQVTKIGGTYDKIGDVYFPNMFTKGWGPNIGNLTPAPFAYGTVANLANDHPVSFTWVDGVPGVKNYATWSGTALKLFNNRMECSTCHDVHNSANPPFLRMSNINSNMCTTCHSK